MEAGLDLSALAAWMDGEGLGAGPLTACVAAGRRHAEYPVEIQTRRAAITCCAAPRCTPATNSNETMLREARLLAALADTNVPHPRFIASCADEIVLGGGVLSDGAG